MKIQRLSWAGVKVECGTTTVLIDPTEDRIVKPGGRVEFPGEAAS